MYKQISSQSNIFQDTMDRRPIDNQIIEIDYDIDEPLNQYLVLKPDEIVGLITYTICQFTQEIVTFPIYTLYITSQIMSNPYPSFYSPWSVANSLYNSYIIGNGSQLWRGFPSYTILSGSISIGDTFLCYLTQKYITNKWLSSPILFIERCAANFIVAPFYTTMLIDCILSDSVSGLRSPLFFIVEGSKLILSKRYRYKSYSFSYLSSRPLNLYNRFIAYIMVVFGRCLISNIVCRFYTYFYIKTTNNIIENNNNSNNHQITENNMNINRYDDKITANMITNIITDTLMIPIMSSSIKCLIQGLDIFVDTISKQSVDSIGSNILPATQTYFKDIFECITTTYDDYGVFRGFFKGFGAILLGSLVKYLIVRIFRKFLHFYNQQTITYHHEQSSSFTYSPTINK